MSLIAVADLGLTLANPLFSGLNFTLSRGDRLGLIAANGRGKSSLLACLTGAMAPTTGTITRARGARASLVAQDVEAGLLPLTFTQAVTAALPDPDEDWRVAIALDDLGIPGDLRDRPLRDLSGGWRRMAALARALVTEPDVLLLDEPTNHLDLSRTLWLEQFLRALPRDLGVILTSHDRAFLDAVCTRTLFLRPERSATFALPYTRARVALEEMDLADSRKFANDLRMADQLRRQAAKLKNIGINSGSDLLVVKTKQLTERANRLEAAARPAHQERSAGDIRLEGQSSHARALMTFPEGAVAAPDGKPLFRMGQMWISPGDRVVLLGANGAGKSTLVRLVARACGGGPSPVRAAPAVRLGHVDQDLSGLDGAASPLDAITARSDIGDQRALGVLAGAGIGVDLAKAPLTALSGGQRARLMLLVLRLIRPNFYLLDEPTNHLDIEGQEALEAELADDAAAALIVSHDRAFVANTGTRFWLIDRGRLTEVGGPGDWFARLG
jgi:ATPase subunit of ABC transporter with duplicated ATPase domains